MFVVIQRLDHPSHQNEFPTINVIENNPPYPWFTQIYDYLTECKLPSKLSHSVKQSCMQRITRYVIIGSILYKCSFDDILLRCLKSHESTKAIEEVCYGICGVHFNGNVITKCVIWLGYY